MTLKFDEILKRMYVGWLLYVCSVLNWSRTHRHISRLGKLQSLLERRAAIEACMIASTKNIENATIWVEKALHSSLQRRIHGLQRY